MYGIVLMAALSGNADVRVQETATGSMYHQTQEYRHRRGHGCCGGGCYGGGCYGGCYGGYASAGYGCCGGRAYGDAAPAPAGYRANYAPGPFDAVGTNYAPIPAPGEPRPAPAPAENGRRAEGAPRPIPAENGWQEGTLPPSRALLIVRVPENAKVFIEDKPTQSTGDTRTYVSPPLPPSGEFHYTVRAEIVREGQTIAAGKAVTVRAGRPTQVTFDMPAFKPEPKQ